MPIVLPRPGGGSSPAGAPSTGVPSRPATAAPPSRRGDRLVTPEGSDGAGLMVGALGSGTAEVGDELPGPRHDCNPRAAGIQAPGQCSRRRAEGFAPVESSGHRSVDAPTPAGAELSTINLT